MTSVYQAADVGFRETTTICVERLAGPGAAAERMREAANPFLTVRGEIPAARVHELRGVLPGLTRGEGVLECAFDRYEPVAGPVPARPRWDANPVNREEYLQRVTRRANLTVTEPLTGRSRAG